MSIFDMISLMNIGEKIAYLRRKKGISQKRLGWKTDLDSSYISRIETGKIKPGIQLLIQISKALNVDLVDVVKESNEYNWFLDSIVENPADDNKENKIVLKDTCSPFDSEQFDETTKEILRLLNQMSREKKKETLKYIHKEILFEKLLKEYNTNT